MRRKQLLGVAILLVFGVLRMPVEQGLTQRLRDLDLKDPPPEVSWEQNFLQMSMATLGGLRGVVASIGYLQAYAAWEDYDWGTVDDWMSIATHMQPREPIYWDEASWHMAYNAASSFLRDKELRAALRNRQYRDHVQRGIDILNEGLRYIPNSPRLLEGLGYLYKDRQPNPALAAEAFLKAYENGSLPFYERLAAYEMVKAGDRESSEKAYAILKRYYDQGPPFTRMASIVRDLRILEARLNIPAEQRIRPAPEAEQQAPKPRVRRSPNQMPAR